MRNEGFSLLEVLVALTIISTALVAVFRLQAQSLDLQAEAKFYTVAEQLAQGRLDGILAQNQLRIGTETGDFGQEFSGYTYRTEITSSATEGLNRVQVSVFSELAGRSRRLSLVSYVYR